MLPFLCLFSSKDDGILKTVGVVVLLFYAFFLKYFLVSQNFWRADQSFYSLHSLPLILTSCEVQHPEQDTVLSEGLSQLPGSYLLGAQAPRSLISSSDTKYHICNHATMYVVYISLNIMCSLMYYIL